MKRYFCNTLNQIYKHKFKNIHFNFSNNNKNNNEFKDIENISEYIVEANKQSNKYFQNNKKNIIHQKNNGLENFMFGGLYNISTFKNPQYLKYECDKTINQLNKDLTFQNNIIKNIFKSNTDNKYKHFKIISYIEFMDKISNELCILIDCSSSIVLLYEDEDFKMSSNYVIDKVSVFMDKLNNDKDLFNNIVMIKNYLIENGYNSNQNYKEKLHLIENMISGIELLSPNCEFNNEEVINKLDINFELLNKSLDVEYESNLQNKMTLSDYKIDIEITKEDINSIDSISLKSYLTILYEYEDKNINYNLDNKVISKLLSMSIDQVIIIINQSNNNLSKRGFNKILNIFNNKYETILEILKCRLVKANAILCKYNLYNKVPYIKQDFNFIDYKIKHQTIKHHNSLSLLNIFNNLYLNLIPNLLSEYHKLIHYNYESLNCKNTLTYKDITLKKEEYIKNKIKTLYSNIEHLRYDTSNKNLGKDYLTIQNILNGLIILSKDLFNIELDFVLDEDMIQEMMLHKSVLKCIVKDDRLLPNKINPKIFDVNDSSFIKYDNNFIEEKEGASNIIGYLYLDLFKRDGKDKSVFSHLTIRGSKILNKHKLKFNKNFESNNFKETETIIQKPISVIATNLEVNSYDLLNMNVSYEDCKGIFHEFGHALHSILSTTEFQSLSGTRICLDFAEIPSHFIEKFVYNYSFCKKWMIDRNLNNSIPEDLFNTLCINDVEFECINLLSTLFNSIFDVKLNSFSNINDINEENILNCIDINNCFKKKGYNNINDLSNGDNIFTIPSNNNFYIEYIKIVDKYNKILIYKKETNILDLSKLLAYNNFEYEISGYRFNNRSNSNYLTNLVNDFNNEIFNLYQNEVIKTQYYKDNLALKEGILYILSPHFLEYSGSYYTYIIGKVYSNNLYKLYIKEQNKQEFGEKIRKTYLSKGLNHNPIDLINYLNTKI